MKISDLKKTRKRAIYLDMDGVIVDFNKHFVKLTGVHPEALPDNDTFWKIFNNHAEGFFSDAPPFNGYLEFVNEIKELAYEYDCTLDILTAIPRKSICPYSEREKKEWVKEHGVDIKVNVGPYAVNKQDWCKPGDVLIDDSEMNIAQWKEKQGIAIHHKNFADSLAKLREALVN